MKRTVLCVIGAALLSAAGAAGLWAKERKATKEAAPAAQPSAPAAAALEEGTVAFTFKDEDQMREFGKLWTLRQASLTRLAVLQDYATEEQAELASLNKLLLSQYNLDIQKNYTLNTDHKTLIEKPLPIPAEPPIAAPDAPPAAPAL